jgi:diguanylate cyclase (GGDEF)-like protein
MNNRQKKSFNRLSIMFLPISFLLVLIFLLLYKFGMTSKTAAHLVVEDELAIETANFTIQIHEELNVMTKMGIAFRDMLVNMPVESLNDATQMIGTLCNNSKAYMVVYCDKEGIGVTHSGIKVNVAKDNFLHQSSEQYYAYIQKENIMQAEAVVSIIPVVKKGTTDGYILMYYSVSHIRKLFKNNTAFDNAFMIFSVDDGVVITSEGLNEKPEEGSTLFEVLSKLDSEAETGTLKEAAENMNSASVFLKKQDDERYVIFIPVEINDWYIAIGYEKALYDQMLMNEWADIRKLITYLLVLIIVFIVVMSGITLTIQEIYKKHNKKLQKEANTDLLTNLYNKMTTERMVTQYFEENPNRGALLLVVDIDDFKGINDTMGHLAGDEVLKSIGCFLKEKFGEYNVLGRVGGDEFIIFLKHLDTEEVLCVEMKRAGDLFKAFPKRGDHLEEITFSIGAAKYPKDADNFEDLYQIADRALYEAKRNGKNQLV